MRMPEGAEFKVITFVLYAGGGARVLTELHRRGVDSACLHHVRGSAIGDAVGRDGLPTAYRKEMITAIVPADRADDIFKLMYEAADIDRSYGGFIYMGKLQGATGFELPLLPEEGQEAV